MKNKKSSDILGMIDASFWVTRKQEFFEFISHIFSVRLDMSSIAMFPCTFTPVAEVAEQIAKKLGLQMYNDKDLMFDTAQKYNVSVDKLEQALYGKTSVFNQFTLEKEKTINQLKAVLGEKLAVQEHCLYYGYMALLLSPKISHVLKVLLVAAKKSRIEKGIASGLTQKESKKIVHADDVKAYGFSDFLYKKEPFDSSLYDLVAPVELKSEDDLVEIVCRYYHKTSLLPSPKSLQGIRDMMVEVLAESRMLEAGHKLDIHFDDGDLLIKVEKSVFNFDKLVAELTGLAKEIEGVKKVTVEKSYNYNDSIYRRQRFDLPSKVLFVDDEKEFVQTVSDRLISRDVGTYGVFNGEDALDLIREDRPDVMVLDLKMPGMYGVEVLRKTKEIAPEVEVIILTGHGSNQDMLDCMELGAFAYMNKPIDIEELSATIKAAYKKAYALDGNGQAS